MTVVIISADDVAAIADVARRRNAENRKAGQADGLVDKSKGSVSADVEGALGEYAVAHALQLPWDGAFKDYEVWLQWRNTGHDVSGIEVRTTRHLTGRLIVQPWNDDDRPYVLVVLSGPADDGSYTADIKGWAWGREAKHSCYWMSRWPRPTYALQQRNLRPLAALAALWQARRTEYDGDWCLSTERMTVGVTVRDGTLVSGPPIVQRFKGQPFVHLVRWLRQQPGFRSARTHTPPS